MTERNSVTMPARAGRFFKRSGAAAVALAGMLGMAGEDVAFAAGPFEGMSGSWTGSGTVSMSTGTKERITCKAQYVTKEDGNNFQQALRCQSASYKFEINAYVDHNGGSLSGYWTELINNVRGGVSGRASGDSVQARLSGTGFAADLMLRTRGTSQSVVITPSADTNTQVQKVAITLRKRS